MIKKYLLCFSLFSLSACGKPESVSETKIINGTMGWFSEQPAIVIIYDRKHEAICTGTFISDSEVLTAAHCTQNYRADSDGRVKGELEVVQVDFDSNGDLASKIKATTVSMVRDPRWEKYGAGVNNFDVALLKFPPGTWGTTAKIATRHARPGDVVELFGYGKNQDFGSGSSSAAWFRKGYNVIESVKGGLISFRGYSRTAAIGGDGTFASAGQGDSGGPLFVNGEIVGIVTGGISPDSSSPYITNIYVDMLSPEAQSFLEHARSL